MRGLPASPTIVAAFGVRVRGSCGGTVWVRDTDTAMSSIDCLGVTVRAGGGGAGVGVRAIDGDEPAAALPRAAPHDTSVYTTTWIARGSRSRCFASSSAIVVPPRIASTMTRSGSLSAYAASGASGLSTNTPPSARSSAASRASDRCMRAPSITTARTSTAHTGIAIPGDGSSTTSSSPTSNANVRAARASTTRMRSRRACSVGSRAASATTVTSSRSGAFAILRLIAGTTVGEMK